MATLIQITTLAESNIKSYLAGISAITYPVYQSFGIDDYVLPCVLVKAGKFSQMEVNTGVFEGVLAVSIISQIDDVAGVVEAHDEITGACYDAMADNSGLNAAFNDNGQLWFINLNSIDQEKQDRALITILEYSIVCQNQSLETGD